MTVPVIDYEEIDKHLPDPEHWVTFQSQRVPGVRDRWWSILNAQIPHLDIPVIFDADYFRSLFHDPNRPRQDLSLNPLSQPPRERFQIIYEEFGKGSLRVWDPQTQPSPFKPPLKFDPSNPASRLMDSSQHLRKPVARWLPRIDRDRTFESTAPEEIVTKTTSWYALSPYITPTHSHYNWLDIYCRAFGRSKSEQGVGNAALIFALKTNRHFYNRIAPLIDLWHWDVRIEIAKRSTKEYWDRTFGNFVHGPQTLSLIQQLQLCCTTISYLNFTFLGTITQEEIDHLSSQTNAYGLVAFIATNQPIRAVVRLLPKGGPAELMAGLIREAIRFVPLGGGAGGELPEIVKFLRDVTTESDLDPDLGLRYNAREFRPSFPPQGTGPQGPSTQPTSEGSVVGSEAHIIFGTMRGQEVAVREPLDFTNFDRDQHEQVRLVRQYIFRKRYKRTLVQQHCLTHRNLMPILGWFKKTERDLLPSAVMPRMKRPLEKYQIRSVDEYNRLMSGLLQGLNHLHAWGVVHGDLHWGNILISPQGEAIITDFGHSRLLIKRMHEFRLAIDSNTTPPLPSKFKLFMPPEIRRLSANESDPYKSDRRPDDKTDIYSLGIVMLLSALPRDIDAETKEWQQVERKRIATRLVDLIAGHPDNVDEGGQSRANTSSLGSKGSMGAAAGWGSFGLKAKATQPKTKNAPKAAEAGERLQKANIASIAPRNKPMGTAPGSRSAASTPRVRGSKGRKGKSASLMDLDDCGVGAVMNSPAAAGPLPPPDKLDSSSPTPGPSTTIVPLQSIPIPTFAELLQLEPARAQGLWELILRLVDRNEGERLDVHKVIPRFLSLFGHPNHP